jgi:hypothetical protein
MLPRRRMGSSHVIYTSGFFFLTLSFALIGIIALTLRFAAGPPALRVAVGPEDGVNAKLITAIAHDLEHDGSGIRFVIIPVDDLKQSAQALAQGRSDLAVIRSDVSIPPNGATVVILHNDVAVLTALPGSKITKLRDLTFSGNEAERCTPRCNPLRVRDRSRDSSAYHIVCRRLAHGGVAEASRCAVFCRSFAGVPLALRPRPWRLETAPPY